MKFSVGFEKGQAADCGKEQFTNVDFNNTLVSTVDLEREILARAGLT